MLEKRKMPIYIFFGFFMIYMFLGMCISFRVIYPQNIFFAADNYRVFLDLTDISNNHYRITVHPLFLLLLEAPTLALTGIVQKANLAVIIEEAMVGALSVTLMERITYELNVEARFRYVFAIIYGMSFSMLLFSTIPESFIFSGLVMESFWYVILLMSKSQHKEATKLLNKRDIFILCSYGILSFGITLTNYAFYLVGLVTILFIRSNGKIKSVIKDFLNINVLCGIFVGILCVIQKLAWRQSPFFLMSFLRTLVGTEAGETMYMDITPSVSKFALWIRETLCYPLICPSIYLDPEEAWYPGLLFGSYNWAAIVIIFLFFVGFICAIALSINTVAKIEKKEKIIVGAMAINLVGNLLLHYIYDSSEAFIFSCHYIFLLFILYSYLASKISNKLVKNILFGSLLITTFFEITNNISRFFESVNLALKQAGEHFSLLTSVIGTIIAVIGILVAATCIKHSRGNKLTLKEDSKHTEKPDDRLQDIAKILFGYFIFIVMVTVFIGFSAQTVTVR